MAEKRATRQEKKAKLRADLLDAAEELFAARGYWGVSIDQIAEKAGVTKGAVYSNFTKKEQLLLEVTWRQRIDLDPSLLNDMTLPLDEFAKKLGEEIARIATSDEQARLAPRSLEVSLLALTNEEIARMTRELARNQRDAVASLLQERAEHSGVELPLAAEELASIMLAVQRGLMQQRFVDPDAVPAKYFVDALALLFGSTQKRRSSTSKR